MEAYSVEDNGALIKFCVFCYNVQPRIEINYATGDSMIISDESPFTKNVYVGSDSNYNYVLNSNTKRFHLPTCTSVYDIKSKNIKYYEGNRENLINMGYIPCKACNP
jgi:DNA-entry nuclease